MGAYLKHESCVVTWGVIKSMLLSLPLNLGMNCVTDSSLASSRVSFLRTSSNGWVGGASFSVSGKWSKEIHI